MGWETWVFAAIPWVYIVWERIIDRRDYRRAETRRATSAICDCDHILTAHDGADNTGACTAQVRREHYSKGGDRSGWEYVACPCRAYHGPIPLEREFTRPQPLVLPQTAEQPEEDR